MITAKNFKSFRAVSVFSFAVLLELARGGVPWVPAFLLAVAALAYLRLNGGAEWKDSPWAVFWACLACYLATFRWHGGDDVTNSLIPFCVLRHGTLALNPVLDPWLTGKANDFTVVFGPNTLSVYAIAGGILALPLYVVPVLAGVVPSEQFLHNLSKISGSVITAASAAALFAAIRGRASPEWALCLALLYGLGSWTFSVSSQALWQHAPGLLGTSLGLLGLAGAGFWMDALAGFGFGLAVAGRPDTIFYAAAAGVYVLFRRTRRVPGFAAGAAVPAILLGSYWLYYTGRLRPPESEFQSTIFAGFQPSAFLALWASPTRGLFFFFPAAAFGAWGAWKRRRDDGLWLLAPCVATAVFMSFYVNWTGGQTFGPRYFATAALVLTYLCADLERDVRSSDPTLRLWCGAVAGSVLIHALGGFLNWPGSYALTTQAEQVWWWSLHPISNMFTARGGLGGLNPFVRAGIGMIVLGAFAYLSVRLCRELRDVR
ncbi:MAG: hypothetical protein HY078_05910 [Elusimicrobia bacterium]|nr:hypothetical protein [Elusimicrobiota bacterium]